MAVGVTFEEATAPDLIDAAAELNFVIVAAVALAYADLVDVAVSDRIVAGVAWLAVAVAATMHSQMLPVSSPFLVY